MISTASPAKRIALLLCVLFSLASVRGEGPVKVAENPSNAEIPPQKKMTQADGPGGTTIIRDLEIAKVGNFPLLADMAYLKAASPAPRPVMFIIHGGGWAGGSKSLNLDWAQKGYFVFSVDYRLSKVAKWPAQIGDCKLALRWLRAHAQEYDIDPDKIGVYGHSAGGHLVCCMATLTDSKWDVGDYQGFSSAVQCVVDLAGPSDLTTYFKDQPKSILSLFGQAGLDDPQVVAAASPVNHVRASLPPFMILHGDLDKNVPISQAEEMVAALQKAGSPVQFLTIHNAGHSFGHAQGDPVPQPSIAEYQAMVLDFMDKNLKSR